MIVPTGSNILVEPDPVETKTKSGIVLATDTKLEAAASVTGTVIAVGEVAFKELSGGSFKTLYEPFARIGDRIQFRRYTGVAVRDPDTEKEYFLMRDADVLGRWEKGENNGNV